MNLSKLLSIAGVPADLCPDALACLSEAERRARGLTWFKVRTRLFKAGMLADQLTWGDNRLASVRPDLADHDIAPMLNITCNGDNGPWIESPLGGRPIENAWLNDDPESQEYAAAVATCYWCPGKHPRSRAARKAWFRRNGGEFRAWRLGAAVDESGRQVWRGESGSTAVTVYCSGGAWQVNAQRKLLGRLVWDTRVGYEVDNVFSGPLAPRMWYPAPGYDLRAPVTWSRLPAWR